jgi:Putative Actinobacterial Holin-X, holin superfamily III
MSIRRSVAAIRQAGVDAIRLLKLEAGVVGHHAKGAARSLGLAVGLGVAAAVFGILGLLLLLLGAVAGLVIVFPSWLAFLVVGSGSIAVAVVVILRARRALAGAIEQLSLVRDEAKEVRDWIQEFPP